MKQLSIATMYEFKDRFHLFENRKDIEFFSEIAFAIAEGCWFVDRTNTIQMPFKTILSDKYTIPDLSNVKPLSLEECCADSATRLLASNSKLYFLYSGGIDSTLALVSFIKAGATRDQLIVVCSPDSIRENPNFYYDHVRMRFNLLSSDSFIQQMKTRDLNGKVVICEPADILVSQCYSGMAFKLFGGDFLTKPATQGNILQFLKGRGLSDPIANCCADMHTVNIKYSPRPIVTMYDFFWWAKYNWRWQYQGEKLQLRTTFTPDIETFYSTLEFQKWGATHTQVEINKISDFKKDYKQIIYNFTNDKEYFDLKVKHTSVSYLYLADSFVAMEADGTKLKATDFSLMNYYQEDNFIADWIRDN